MALRAVCGLQPKESGRSGRHSRPCRWRAGFVKAAQDEGIWRTQACLQGPALGVRERTYKDWSSHAGEDSSSTTASSELALGRWGGRPLILRYGHLLRVNEAELDRADDWFDRYGGVGGVLRPDGGGGTQRRLIPAGLSEMPLGCFSLLTALGSAVWNSLLIGVG